MFHLRTIHVKWPVLCGGVWSDSTRHDFPTEGMSSTIACPIWQEARNMLAMILSWKRTAYAQFCTIPWSN